MDQVSAVLSGPSGSEAARARTNTLGQYGRDGPLNSGIETAEVQFSFGDLLDIVNPLQHIPIVNSIYRVLTGDTISGHARVMGAALYGGPIGMIAGAANAVIAEVRGADVGDTIVAGLLGREVPGAPDGETETGIAVAERAAATAAPPEPEPSRPEPAPGPANAFAPAGPAAGLVLNGDAALSALLGDLRASSRGDPAPSAITAAPRIPVAQMPLDTSPLVGAVLDRDRQDTPTHAFSRRMMLGLEKYQALTAERGGPGRPAARVE